MRIYVIGFGLLLLLLVSLNAVYVFGTQDTVVATVTDKDRITTGSGKDISSKYLVFTDKEVFENTDSLLLFKFNSSDVQGKLRAGSSYRLDVYGWRLPFFSSYRNIVAASPQSNP